MRSRSPGSALPNSNILQENNGEPVLLEQLSYQLHRCHPKWDLHLLLHNVPISISSLPPWHIAKLVLVPCCPDMDD